METFDCDNIKRTAIAARNKPKILNRGESWFWMEKLLNYEQRVCQALP